MKTNSFLFIALVILGFARCNSQVTDSGASYPEAAIMPNGDSVLIGTPVSYKNLQVFPVISNVKYANLNLMVLSDALEKKKAVVEETGDVGQLQIDNMSDEYILILAGDIVKGGRQDRTMGNDVIVAPHEKDVPLESYCVESGRWQQRGEEASAHFSDNTKMLSSKELKMASRYEKDQSAVWQKVSEEQEELKKNVSSIKGQDVEVKSSDSETSLQLTLENKDLADVVKEYRNNLSGLNHSPANTIGYAYAINGKLYGIDLYSDTALFHSVSQKLIEAMVVEAISDLKSDSSFTTTDAAGIAGYLSEFDKPAAKVTKINSSTSLEVSETEKAVKFETKLTDRDEQWVRKNYLVKDEEEKKDR
jgi:hypothetical protein